MREELITPRSNPIKKYFADVTKYPLLSVDEEVELFRKFNQSEGVVKQGYKDKIVNSNLRFVISIAKEYNNNDDIFLMELIQEGNIGLCAAVDRFDETRGFKFISYAVRYIRQSIMQYITNNKSNIRIPMNRNISFKKINKLIGEYVKLNGIIPSFGKIVDDYYDKYCVKIADELGEAQTKKKIEKIVSDYFNQLDVRHIESLDAYPTTNDDKGLPLRNFVADDKSEQPDKHVELKSQRDVINDAISKLLTEKESFVIKSIYCENPKTEREISKILDISVEKVKNIKKTAQNKLKQGLSKLQEYQK